MCVKHTLMWGYCIVLCNVAFVADACKGNLLTAYGMIAQVIVW